jgi:hypothetical protein
LRCRQLCVFLGEGLIADRRLAMIDMMGSTKAG